MCVGSELTARAGSAQPSFSGISSRPKPTKSTATIPSRPPLKQITGPEAVAPIVESPSSAETSPNESPSPAKIDPPQSSVSAPMPGITDYIGDNDETVHQFRDDVHMFQDLPAQMDGITLMMPESTNTSQYEAENGDHEKANQMLISASPPSETYMEIEAKRPRRKRDRFPKLQQESGDNYKSGIDGTKWSDRDLVPALLNTPNNRDLLKEIARLRLELEASKQQNDILNKKLLLMAEGANVLNQLQQYMTHMKILPPSVDQGMAVSKELSVHNTLSHLSPAELKNMTPFAAFRDSCVRYPHLPIALFNITQSSPVVAVANDSFNRLFSVDDAQGQPWVHFIAPTHLERTKQLLFRALSEHEAIKFVQVYKQPSQKLFLALDVHRFFRISGAPFGSLSPTVMDLVFIVTGAHLKYPPPEDYTFWRAPLNDQGLVGDLQAFADPATAPPASHSTSTSSSTHSFEYGTGNSSSSSAHPIDHLTSSTGISFVPSAPDGAAPGVSNGVNSGVSSRIDIFPSPSAEDISSPSIDRQYDGSIAPMPPGTSPRLSASPLDPNPWLNYNTPEYVQTTWGDANSAAGYADWMQASGGISLPPHPSHIDPSAHHYVPTMTPPSTPSVESNLSHHYHHHGGTGSGIVVEELRSPSSPGYQPSPSSSPNTSMMNSVALGTLPFPSTPPVDVPPLLNSTELPIIAPSPQSSADVFPSYTTDFDQL